MLIAFDIGNTAVTYGVAEKGTLKRFGSCIFNDIPKFIQNCSISGKNNQLNVIISSVVPENTKKLGSILSHHKACKVWVLGQNLKLHLKSRYHSKQIGIDRLVNVYGGLKFFKAPFLVIDFGTAITFDYVSPKGVFEGGMIIPGPELSFQALIQKAAKLPKKARLPLKSPHFLGTNTLDSLKSGILEGYGSLTDELISRFKKRFGSGLKVIATGGFSHHLKPYTRSLKTIEPKLSVKSLIAIAAEHKIS